MHFSLILIQDLLLGNKPSIKKQPAKSSWQYTQYNVKENVALSLDLISALLSLSEPFQQNSGDKLTLIIFSVQKILVLWLL